MVIEMEEKEIIKLKKKVKKQEVCIKEKDKRIRKIENYFELRNLIVYSVSIVFAIAVLNVFIFIDEGATVWLHDAFGYLWYLVFVFLVVCLFSEILFKIHKYDYGCEPDKEDKHWTRCAISLAFLFLYVVAGTTVIYFFGVKDVPSFYAIHLLSLFVASLITCISFFILAINASDDGEE